MVFTVEKCFKSYSWVDSFLILVLKKLKIINMNESKVVTSLNWTTGF